MRTIRCSIVASLTLAGVLCGATSASAQGGAAIAEGLFRDGKKLLDAKNYAEACPKFEESARIEPSSGVELALGLCYEGLGKTASAWAAYQTAVSLARRDNRRDREHAASSKATALEPKIAHATIDVPAEVAQLPGLVVKEDSVVIGAAAWKNAPIDPGTHALEVTATGKKPWSTSFTVDPAPTPVTVTVPKLEDAPIEQSTERVVLVDHYPFRTASYVTLGAGLAAVLGASILGGVAIGDAGDAHKTCPTASCSNAGAVSENNTAGSLADWSTALFVVSGVCFAATVAFFLIHSSPPATHGIGIHPLLAPNAVGVGGVF
jgi:hypothetical protein